MKIILAPDSFKGSLSAIEAAESMAAGVRQADGEIEVVLLPVADGGEGTMEAMVTSTNGRVRHYLVEDPLGRSVRAGYGILDHKPVCMIELAEASGLTLLKQEGLDPLNASSFGTGQLIRHALDDGYREFIIGLGGSATNDGGAGILQALGARLLDAEGHELPKGGGHLDQLSEIDLASFDHRLAECFFTIACDVDNPFVGPRGASAVFGPQKGATPDLVQLLDRNLTHFANKIEAKTGVSLHDFTGAGAAGGAGGAFLAFFQSRLRTGIEVVLEALEFDQLIESADLILTGEGRSDSQTLSGKAPVGIAKEAKKRGIPVVLVSGGVDEQSIPSLLPYFEQIHSLSGGAVSVEKAIHEAASLLTDKTTQIIKTYQTTG